MDGAAPTRPVRSPASTARAGVIYGVAAYGLWGIFPFYFKAIEAVPVFEVHRATLDDHRGQVSESAEQTLLGTPVQSKIWRLEAGVRNRYDLALTCGAE